MGTFASLIVFHAAKALIGPPAVLRSRCLSAVSLSNDIITSREHDWNLQDSAGPRYGDRFLRYAVW